MKKPTVTIFIPAYNEENNIKSLLEDVLKQNQKTFELKNILVVSDGSTDKTVDCAKEIINKKIIVLNDKKRKGKVSRIIDVLKQTSTDILVQLDADIRIFDKETLDKLIEPYIKDNSIGILCGNHLPLKPKTFIEKLSYFGVNIWNSSLDKLGDESIMYRCVGHIRGFGKTFYKHFNLTVSSGSTEDTYSFYYAAANNYKVVYIPKAIVYHRLPTTAKDYLKQMTRFLNEREALVASFGEALISKYETLNSKILLASFIETAKTTSPFVIFGYAIIQIWAHLLPKIDPSLNGKWEISTTTKKT